MMKKWISLVLALAMVASMVLPVGAITYSDLSGHWAEDYVLELVELGYLNGYTDGTMQPDGNITTVEALALLSRFYDLDDAVVEEIHNEHGEDVERILEPSLSWAYDEVEICVAAGIVSITELGNLPMTTTVEKELLSVLLVRAIQKIDEAKANDTVLTFDDTDTITSSYLPYVAELVDNGIITGDNNNNFTPKSAVTRAVVATMLVRALDMLEEEGTTLELSEYDGFRTIEGLIVDFDEDDLTFQLRDVYGKLYELTYDATTTITEGGSSTEFNEYKIGEYATVNANSAGIRSIDFTDIAYGAEWVQGMMTSYSPGGSGSTMKIKNMETSTSTSYVGINGIELYKNDESVSTLASGLFATALKDSSGVSLIYAYTPDFEVTGTISTLTIGTTVDFAITLDYGDILIYPMSISDLPDMVQDDLDIDISQLSIGDSVTLTINDAVVTDIESHAEFVSLIGTLTAITNALTGTSWTVTDDNGVSYELTLSSSVVAWDDDDYMDVDDISVGDYLSIRATGTKIMSMVLLSATSNSATKLTGNILTVDTSEGLITMYDDDGNLVFVSMKTLTTFWNAVTGVSSGIKYLYEGDYILVYGNYTDSTNFTATNIVKEG